jgi:hypothetical protein
VDTFEGHLGDEEGGDGGLWCAGSGDSLLSAKSSPQQSVAGGGKFSRIENVFMWPGSILVTADVDGESSWQMQPILPQL